VSLTLSSFFTNPSPPHTHTHACPPPIRSAAAVGAELEALVLTSDTDFAIFPCPGYVDLNTVHFNTGRVDGTVYSSAKLVRATLFGWRQQFLFEL
jgi:hypothetical protein